MAPSGHDLLPLDFPEYFRPGYGLVPARFELMAQRARAIVTTCGANSGAAEGRVQRLGPALSADPCAASRLAARSHGRCGISDAELAKAPYFVMVGTLEKITYLLLNVWRKLVARGGGTPKLVCVGGSGRGAAQIIDGLERSKILAPHVRRVSGLLLKRLLAPNLAEGSLPLVEGYDRCAGRLLGHPGLP